MIDIFKKSMPSVLNNPFDAQKVSKVLVCGYLMGSRFVFYGNVEFKNGNTTGTQNFDGASFDEVMLKIKAFMEELK